MSMLNMYCAVCPTNIRKFIINLPGIMALAAGIAVVDGDAAWQAARAEAIAGINARVIATNIPGASAIAQVGMFLNVPPTGCLCKSDSQQVPLIHPTGRGAGSEPNPGRQPVELRRAARHRRRAGGLVPVDRPEQAGYPERPAEFRTERRSGLNPRRRRADVQRKQPPLAQWRQQHRCEDRFSTPG